MTTEGFLSIPYIQWVWLGHLFLVLPSLFMCVVLGYNWDKSAGLPSSAFGGADQPKLKFWQFRKKLHLYYFVGLVWVILVLWNFLSVCLGGQKSERLEHVLDVMTKPERISTRVEDAQLAGFLYLLHILKRLYETARVSIFSRRQVLNPFDLLLGYGYYIAAGLSLVAEVGEVTGQDCWSYTPGWASVRHLVALLLFTWPSYQQGAAHRILAKLRRNRAGHIVTTGYKVPKAGWFQYCSTPHYFCEIIIHIAIGLILGFGNVTWWLMTSYVVANQVFLAYNTHTWYNKKFDEYPKDRKIIIPFLL